MVLVTHQNTYFLAPPVVPVPPPSEFLLVSDSITPIEMVSGQEIYFRDSGGVSGPYENSKFYRQPFRSSTGFRLTSVSYTFAQITYAMYDRLGLQTSVDQGVTWQNLSPGKIWLQKSATSVIFLERFFCGKFLFEYCEQKRLYMAS